MSKELAEAMPNAGDPNPEAQALARSVIEAGSGLDFDIEVAYKEWRDSANTETEIPKTIDGFHDSQTLIAQSLSENKLD
ncbi:hypothetical protein QA600_15055 [Natronococcus sp. A-GB1]|uniref:hypothetical protein n=1 Tax=Natronococcus sp. A-GB1 TaxID=3037648 RepID=UPI00241DAD8F|nr:hypothetical protein [Natronococcus sp. A-GB1]MDG5760653.1 hypothetical protein [Natronococcus sp. A-GB1]